MTVTCPDRHCGHEFKITRAVVRSMIECPECGQGFDWTRQICAKCRHTTTDCTCGKPQH